MRDTRCPIVVALNKADLVKKDLPWVLENAEKLLGVRPEPGHPVRCSREILSRPGRGRIVIRRKHTMSGEA